ncbi:MAG: transcriptional regulator [Fusobacteriaceae bacterium]|jgi:transcriptional regulator with XRE-family HTH domain|nr:transcriptional regulator [Fusobacteriaceae bacterium]
MKYEEHEKFLIKKLHKGKERITLTKKMSLFLKKERKKTMFTRREIGKMVGITYNSMADYEDMELMTMPKSNFEKLQNLYKDFRDGKLKPKYVLNTKSIREEITRKRKEINYTIPAFADKVGSKMSIITSFEHGRTKIILFSVFEKIETFYKTEIKKIEMEKAEIQHRTEIEKEDILHRAEIDKKRYKTNSEILGIYLRQARNKNMLTQAQVAEKLNIGHARIGNYERGLTKNVNKNIIEKLKNLYGINDLEITSKNIKNSYKSFKNERLILNFTLNTKPLRKKLTNNREKSKYSTNDVENMLNIPKHTIANIESGEIKYIPNLLFNNIKTLYQSKIDKMEVIAYNKIIGINLRKARIKNGLSLNQASKMSNISSSVMSRYENGKIFNMQENIINKMKKLYKIK